MIKYKGNCQGRFEVRTARSADAVEEIRQEWQRLQWHPNADIDFFLMIMKCRPEIVRPHVISLWEDGQVVAIAVCRIEATKLKFTLGYKTVFQPKVRQLILVHGGLLGEQTAETSSVFFAAIMTVLQDREADVAVFSDLAKGDLRDSILTLPSYFCRDHAPRDSPHWIMSVPATLDDFYQKFKPKRRHEMRRVANQLERTYPGQIELRAYEGAIDVNAFCRDIEKVASKTYHRGLRAGFSDNEENRRRIALSSEKGWLRAYVMYIAQQPVVFWIGTVYGTTLFLNSTGYDPDFERHEVGTISFVRMVDDLCKRADVHLLDFGSGDAFYKQKFCDSCSNETHAYILAKTPKGLVLGVLMFAFQKISQLLSHIVTRMNLKDKIKRIWRRRLITARSEPSKYVASNGRKNESLEL